MWYGSESKSKKFGEYITLQITVSCDDIPKVSLPLGTRFECGVKVEEYLDIAAFVMLALLFSGFQKTTFLPLKSFVKGI